MVFDKPMVLHSKRPDGRHWLTTVDFPPLQIWPVAPNHCRVGHFLATLVSAKLASLNSNIPEEITLSRADVASVSLDYAIGSERTGVVESGPTQRIAEDYGLVLP